MSDKICKNKFVSLIYNITDENEDILESVDTPIQHIQGMKTQIIEKIEAALENQRAGDLVHVTLSPEEGFGIYQPELRFSDQLSNVPPEFQTVGGEVEFQNDHGEKRVFRVTAIDGDRLTVDGNHPFAGKTITYNITIKEVRDATEKELEDGVEIMTGLH